MDPKDYMIGDILIGRYDDGEHIKEFPVVIDGLDENGTLIDGECEFSWRPLNKQDNDIQYADALFSTLLTPEILKKNGFSRIGYESEDSYSMDQFPFWVEIHEDCKKSYFKQGYSCEMIYCCHYVHELQHALRLCGLDELADNLKIK